jgi:glycosyltransferase involved in cell wall biosynthesis
VADAHSGEAARVKRVAVDLTPLLAGGDNGGIKPLALELVRGLALHAPGCEFILLTSAQSHDGLSHLDAPNVRRVCVSHPEGAPTPSLRRAFAARRLLQRMLPPSVVARLGALYVRKFQRMPAESSLLRGLGAELLFCPFTGIFFYDPTVPVVSVVADLQYLYYPQFFTPEDRHERERNFRHVCQVASRVVCISEYTRDTVLQHSDLLPDRAVVIHIAARGPLAVPSRDREGAVRRYLLYPANFWRHKNHELLLTAFGIYRAAHPQSDLKLVLTGAPSARCDELREAVRRMGLAESVTFAGYLPEEAFASLLAGAAAMIFPSLFEGFGMPVLEAMSAGVPVLCGNLTSLPEIAGDAALLFDPRRPAEIVAAIERLESDPALRADLIERGRRRAAEFLQPAEMATRYWEVFEQAVQNLASQTANRPTGVYGVFPDGWTGPRITVVFGQGATPRRLTLTLRAPEGLPAAVSIRVGGEVHRLPRGRRKTIALELPGQAGAMELLCAPTFQPGGADPRQLGCLLESATIGGPEDADAPPQLPREVHAA